MGIKDDYGVAAGHAAAGRPAEALAVLDDLLLRQPDHPGALCTRGDVLGQLGRTAEALASYDRALAAEPRHLPSRVNRGALLLDLDRPREALEVFDAIVQVNGRIPQAHNNRARALWMLDREVEALAAVDKALALDRNYGRAWMNRAGLLRALGRYAEAREAYAQAARLQPHDGQAVYQASLVRLLERDFGAWSDYEERWRTPNFVANATGFVTDQVRPRLRLRPKAEDFDGRTVLVVGEQGIGDQLMFASLLPDLAARAGAVTCVCDRRLVRLLAHAFPNIRFLDIRDEAIPLNRFDEVVALGSLAHAFRPRADAFPGEAYVRPTAASVAAWAQRLGPRTGPCIGLSWRGGLQLTGQSRRSIDLTQLAPVLALPGRQFISLQYGEAEPDVRRAEAALGREIRVFPPAEIDDFDDLAGLVANLDLVVSVQTALVHLCGALGAPCLTLVPSQPEWRYGAAGETLPWYRSVRLFRQDGDLDWSPVIRRVADAAASLTVV